MNTPLSLTLVLAAPMLLPASGKPKLASPPARPAPKPAKPAPQQHAKALPPRPKSFMPDMVHIPKVYRVTGLYREGDQTFFSGYGRVTTRRVPCEVGQAESLTIQRR